MLVFDQLKKDDPQLRFLAIIVLAGIIILLGGLWWMQVVSVSYYQEKLETQSTRTIRIPAARGKILDRERRSLAANRPSYNIDLYLEELTRSYRFAYSNAVVRMTNFLGQQKAEKQKELGRKLTPQEAKQFVITEQIRTNLQAKTFYQVASNIVADLGTCLQQPVNLSEKTLQSHYDKARALPLAILTSLSPTQVARFEEQSFNTTGVDLDVQAIRYYPNGSTAAHVLGYLQRNDTSRDGETADYNNRLPDYLGVVGVESVFDEQLHGSAGEKSVIINNAGYRQSETIDTPTEPGADVILTIDLDIQKAAERALQLAEANVRGAVVVMDATNGDILAMASAPTYDPNLLVDQNDKKSRNAEFGYLADTNSRPAINRAMFENYPPGSIFKIVVGLAALEQGVLNPQETYNSPGEYALPGLKTPIHDTAAAGPYNFDKAMAKSSNCYFIEQGRKPGVLARMISLGQHLHLGERTGLLPHQEAAGYFPKPKDTTHRWFLADTAYLSFGQGRIAVTPLQMAVMTAAVANGGKVFWPRLVSEIRAYGTDEPSQRFPAGRLRDTLPVNPRNLSIVHEGMRADVEGKYDGTGHKAAVQGLSIAGKTGTAQVEKNGHIDRSAQITWFVSFAPLDAPRWVVVAMVEGGSSGGGTCAPVAQKVYQAIWDKEKKAVAKSGALAMAK